MSLKVYKNGTWTDKQISRVYQSNVWRDCTFVRVYDKGAWVDKIVSAIDLYNNGDECVAKSGGWDTNVKMTSTSDGYSDLIDVTTGEKCIRLYETMLSTGGGVIVTKIPITFTSHSLKIEYKAVNNYCSLQSPNLFGVYVGSGKWTTIANNTFAYQHSIDISWLETGLTNTTSFDIPTDITSGYLYLCANTNTLNTNKLDIHVSRVWLA